MIVRIAVGPVGYIPNVPLRNSIYGVGYVDLRSQALDVGSLVDTAALDRYIFIRNAYLQRRRYLIYDGKPPPEPEDEQMTMTNAAAAPPRDRRDVRAAALSPLAPPAHAQEAPDAMVKRVSQDMLATIKGDPLIQAGNEARIREVIEVKLIPHFDFMRMTALAMGKNWRAATPGAAEAARRRVQDAARPHVFRRAQQVPRRDDRLQAAADESGRHRRHRPHRWCVKSGGQPIQIDYSLDEGRGRLEGLRRRHRRRQSRHQLSRRIQQAGAKRRRRRPHQDARPTATRASPRNDACERDACSGPRVRLRAGRRRRALDHISARSRSPRRDRC